MMTQTNLSYISNIFEPDTFPLSLMSRSPKMVFSYGYISNERLHYVVYRPALLNGRHIVDVLRAVCEPADFSEAELDHVRRIATEGAGRVLAFSWGRGWDGLWRARWFSAVVIVKV